MTTRARAFRATHAPGAEFNPVLPEFHRHAESAGSTGADAAALARTVHLPVASVRAALSSFTEARHDAAAVRVCAGTSCVLAGGPAIAGELRKQHHCEMVYCLGYCDRSPAAMTPSGRVVTGLTPSRFAELRGDPAHPAPPSIRCEARHAVVTRRLGAGEAGDPLAYRGLHRALSMRPDAVTDMVMAAGVRGRGGAAFHAARKWQLAARAPGYPKFVVTNGDEGDPGSFIDRELMERDPHGVLEGMAICAHAIGATRGIVFIRSEYPVSVQVMERAIIEAKSAGRLGRDALGPGRAFDVEVVRGMGSYVCGEETALLAAIEGQRGEVWPRPPYPVDSGVFGRPTVVNNVETIVNVPWILEHGAEAYAEMGTPDSRGTKAVCFNHGFARPGIAEVEFGLPLREVIERHGGGGAGGEPLEAVMVGGPMGSIVLPQDWDAPLCFTAMGRRGINLGHAGLVAIPRGTDWKAFLYHLLVFMKNESCGKCVPCRLGTARCHELATGGLMPESVEEVERILDVMREASLCAFGRETPGPVFTVLQRFRDKAIGRVS
ncbi:MAG: protein disulfide oxidoreductase [Phycisphaerales bacterium]|nr:protein disulfide oxidoreductase [Phycisphaerales bacterium]